MEQPAAPIQQMVVAVVVVAAAPLTADRVVLRHLPETLAIHPTIAEQVEVPVVIALLREVLSLMEAGSPPETAVIPTYVVHVDTEEDLRLQELMDIL